MDKASTQITLFLDSSSIAVNGSITASGQLKATGVDLTGISISLNLTDPDGTIHTATATVSDEFGHYNLPYAMFNKEGVWQIKAKFAGNTNLNLSESQSIALTVASRSGYAILIEGDLSGQWRNQYTDSLDDIRQKMLSKGFTDSDIFYLSYEVTSHAGVDRATTKANIQYAIEQWALDRINQAGSAPLYIVMIDHGSTSGQFYIDQTGQLGSEEYVTPAELNTWLTTLETGLGSNNNLKTIIINGTCYSGTFISALSKKNRVILTSSKSTETSVQGPSYTSLNKQYGELFVYWLFHYLKEGQNLKEAFKKAAEYTEDERCTDNKCNKNSKASINSNTRQHPLLEDNQDGLGSSLTEIESSVDGTVAATIMLGIGTNPVAINWQEVSQTKTVTLGVTSTGLYAKTDDFASTAAAWVEIRKPSYVAPAGENTGQVVMNLPQVAGVSNAGQSRFDFTIGQTILTEAGTYILKYYAADSNGEILPPVSGVLYVNTLQNLSPTSFSLSSPANDMTTDSARILFNWDVATDPDCDAVTYTLRIYADNNGAKGSELKKYELIAQTGYLLDATVETQSDGNTPLFTSGSYYHWDIEAVDSKGASTGSTQTNRFRATFTNTALTAIITGYITDALTGEPVIFATITADIGGTGLSLPDSGEYFLFVPSGNITLTVKSQGYQDSVLGTFYASPGAMLEGKDIAMTPLAPASAMLETTVSPDRKARQNCTPGTLPVLLNSSQFSSLQSAFDAAAADTDIIKIMSGAYSFGAVTYTKSNALALKGGYNSGFTDNTNAYTTISGTVTIQGGTVVIENIVIQ